MLNLRPVIPGIILGIAGLTFGILWAIYLEVGHESMHEGMQAPAVSSVATSNSASTTHLHSDGNAHEHAAKKVAPVVVDSSAGHHAPVGHHSEAAATAHPHDNPLEEKAHESLKKGHVHAMGLGLVTVAVSVVIGLLGASSAIKLLGSLCLGVGGLLYPLSWIIMGFKIPALGLEAAETAILPIVGVGVVLIFIGFAVTLYSLLCALFSTGRTAG
ncbi:MAG: hypothetical protein IME99_02055 [Proteobacteria bacterium]|nr:hypothetical protein [Pseudomonadota bacterium]